MTDPTIDESGFDDGLQDQKEKTFAGQNLRSESLADGFKSEAKPVKSSGSKKYFLSGMAVLIVGIAGYFYFTKSSDVLHKQTFNAETNSVGVIEEQPQNTKGEQLGPLTVGADSQGVKINGHHDLLASMLLQGYPTREEMLKEVSRIQGANVSQEELNVFLLSVKNNADEIRRLKESGGSTAELAQQIAEANKTLKELKAEVSQVNARTQKLEKNNAWYENRLKKLESGISPQSKQAPKPAVVQQPVNEPVRRVELQTQSTWQVSGASENLAFIKNVNSGTSLRVTRGFEIPGCGQVTDINPSQQKVTTTTCIISN